MARERAMPTMRSRSCWCATPTALRALICTALHSQPDAPSLQSTVVQPGSHLAQVSASGLTSARSVQVSALRASFERLRPPRPAVSSQLSPSVFLCQCHEVVSASSLHAGLSNRSWRSAAHRTRTRGTVDTSWGVLHFHGPANNADTRTSQRPRATSFHPCRKIAFRLGREA